MNAVITTAERVRVLSVDAVRRSAARLLESARAAERLGWLETAHRRGVEAAGLAAGLPGGALAGAALRLVARVRARMFGPWSRPAELVPAARAARLAWLEDQQLARAEYDAWQRGPAREFGLW